MPRYLLISILIAVQVLSSRSQSLQEYTCLTHHTNIVGWEFTRKFDTAGIILTNNRYHPLNIAQYGILAYYEFKSSNDSLYFRRCVDQSKYFKDTTKTTRLFDGKGIGLPYTFNFWDLKAPWYSGMTQSQSISYLLRYFDLTKDESVLPIIRKIAYVYLQPQDSGGTISITPEGYPWIEEYPNSEKSPQVLNGFINALIGLKEYVDYFPDDEAASNLLPKVYEGLVNSFEYYDTPTWTNYNRADRPLDNGYLRYEIMEMKHLHEIFGDETFIKQKMIWSVMAYGKHIKDTIGLVKRNSYDFSLPAKKLGNNYHYIGYPDSLTVAMNDTMPFRSDTSLRKLGYSMNRKQRWQPSGIQSFTYLTPASKVPRPANVIEIRHPSIQEINNIRVLKKSSRKKVEWMPTNSLSDNYKTYLILDRTHPDSLIFEFDARELSLTDSISFRFYDLSPLVKPEYLHVLTSHHRLEAGKTYRVGCESIFTPRMHIFYKPLNPKDFQADAKWKARNTVEKEFVPELSGKYQFLIVFEYSSPLSMVRNFKIEEVNPSGSAR